MFDGVNVVTLARTTSVWEKGCSVCRPVGILCSQNTTNFREKGNIPPRVKWKAPEVLKLNNMPYPNK